MVKINFQPFNLKYRDIDWKDRCHISNEEQYITLSNGNRPSHFCVNFTEQTIEFTQPNLDKNNICRFLSNLTSDLTMEVWQEWYDDLCLPGKTEVLHTKTGMRSTRYKEAGPRISYVEYNGDTGKISQDLDTILKTDLPVYVNYVKDAYFDYYAIVIWYHRYKNDKVTYFRPASIADSNIETYPEYHVIDLLNDLCFGVPDHYINPYLVFSKTPNSKRVLITDGERNAGRLLAYSKFENAMMYLPCGMNVFEDYYYMPLLWRKIIVKDSQNLIFKEPRSEAFSVYKRLLDIINPTQEKKGKKR